MRRFALLLALLGWSAACADAAEPALLINGAIVTPGGVIPNGWVTVQGNTIAGITAEQPSVTGARVITTRDFVFPGFVDLHNHPIYAVFPRWKPPRIFANRYQWRADPAYLNAIQIPEGKLVAEHFCDMDAYVELKALMGGTTSVLGVYEPADTPKVPACIAGLARNLDWASGLYGAGLGHERIGNILGVRPNDLTLSATDVARAKGGGLDLAAVHLGEGQRRDPDSMVEFARLKELGLLNAKTAVIHGVALSEDNFAEMKRAGTAFIWSPRSNFELYGETADIAAAVRQNVTMALAPDWSPTGSVNMLGEIVYAKTIADRQFAGLISAQRLFEMATAVPARIARIDDQVGSLAAGRRADLFLLRGSGDAYTALANARPQDVTLTMVEGVPIYGAQAILNAAGATAQDKVAVCGEDRVVNRNVLPAGGLSGLIARLKTALAGEGLTLAGLAECP